MREAGRKGDDTLKRQRSGNRSNLGKRKARTSEFYCEARKRKMETVTFSVSVRENEFYKKGICWKGMAGGVSS